ncbi:MAG: T9SS type A sorting domain-containing protein [Flavobacterium sp.]|uniref:T9SS type A sorting domain-containing protein n=1 Tax=Flavobacterium sp. TaxID=239 RepID=UPI0022BCEA79|nr:T9SS type A sorting domain-containing protein [Flavobacterium sp.]MCZ8330249.1 T9SS type A sorting domain-containing protein [Flavobacterium sp.]
MRKIYLLVFSLISTISFSQQVLKRITNFSTYTKVELFVFRNGTSNANVIGNQNFTGKDNTEYASFRDLSIGTFSIANSNYNYTSIPTTFTETVCNGVFPFSSYCSFGTCIANFYNFGYYDGATYVSYPLNSYQISYFQSDSNNDGLIDCYKSEFTISKTLPNGNPLITGFRAQVQSAQGNYSTGNIVRTIDLIFDGTSWNYITTNYLGNTRPFVDDVCNSLNTSVNEIESNNIILFPNPTDDIVHISTPNETINQINVYDITGRLLKSQNGNNENEIISIQELPSAMYVLEVKTDKESRTTKIIKQ